METVSSITAGHLIDGSKLYNMATKVFTNSNGERFMLTRHSGSEFGLGDRYLNLHKEVKDEYGIPRWEKVGTKVEQKGYKKIYDYDYEKQYGKPKEVPYTKTIEKFDSAGNKISQMNLQRDFSDSAYSSRITTFKTRLYEFFGEKFNGKLIQDVSSGLEKEVKPVKILGDLGELNIKISSLEDLTPALKRILKLLR